MPEQLLNNPYVGACFKQVGSVGMAKAMQGYLLGHFSPDARLVKHFPQTLGRVRPFLLSVKQVLLGLVLRVVDP